jgi:hypothetical protein
MGRSTHECLYNLPAQYETNFLGCHNIVCGRLVEEVVALMRQLKQ